MCSRRCVLNHILFIPRMQIEKTKKADERNRQVSANIERKEQPNLYLKRRDNFQRLE